MWAIVLLNSTPRPQRENFCWHLCSLLLGENVNDNNSSLVHIHSTIVILSSHLNDNVLANINVNIFTRKLKNQRLFLLLLLGENAHVQNLNLNVHSFVQPTTPAEILGIIVINSSHPPRQRLDHFPPDG